MAAPNQPCRHCPHTEHQHELAGPCMVRECRCEAFAAKGERVAAAPLFEGEQQRLEVG